MSATKDPGRFGEAATGFGDFTTGFGEAVPVFGDFTTGARPQPPEMIN